MKKALQYIILIILLTLLGIIWTNKESSQVFFRQVRRAYIDKPCTKPIEYAIGNVDPKFGIGRDEFAADISSAENVWDAASGRTLFRYNPDANFKINLVFDEREQQTLEAEKLNQNLSQLEAAHNSTVQKYNTLNTTFNQRLKEYNKEVADYEAKLEKYNEEVAFWNGQGGAPKDKYDELKNEKSNLNDIYKKLEKERSSLNDLAQKTNNVVQEENTIVNSYNTSLNTYKSKYGDSREFEKGIFNGQEINIYEFRQPQDLKMTLIHELGHALGIGHLNDPKSIMYYMIGEQDLANPHLSIEDVGVLKSVCNIP